MEPTDVTPNSYVKDNEDSNKKKNPKFKVGDRIGQKKFLLLIK